MKKDYSKNNFFNSFGMSLPNNIAYIISIIISLVIFIIIDMPFPILFGAISSFIGLFIGGKLLDKYCINHNIEKCKKCKNWNCRRDILKEVDKEVK